ncbi:MULTISPECIES: hypothetical protein [unclassified Nocardia]|uniref:hypothetical protein n=1 Tax=unclassified Nocardia TaxID=2637762 RepID=UPI001CE41C61|nr:MULTISPECIES: hypothetical protein [unclassified Nocardia]
MLAPVPLTDSPTARLAAAAFGERPGDAAAELPTAASALDSWYRAVILGGQGSYAAARVELRIIRARRADSILLSLAASTEGSLLRQLGWHARAAVLDGHAAAIALPLLRSHPDAPRLRTTVTSPDSGRPGEPGSNRQQPGELSARSGAATSGAAIPGGGRADHGYAPDGPERQTAYADLAYRVHSAAPSDSVPTDDAAAASGSVPPLDSVLASGSARPLDSAAASGLLPPDDAAAASDSLPPADSPLLGIALPREIVRPDIRDAACDALTGLAADALGTGRLALARRLLRRSGELLLVDETRWRAWIRWHWVCAETALAGGSPVALAHAEAAMALAERAPSVRHRVKSRLLVAAANAAAGQPDRAAALAEAVAVDCARHDLLPLRWAAAMLRAGLGPGSDAHRAGADITRPENDSAATSLTDLTDDPVAEAAMCAARIARRGGRFRA